MSDSAPKTSKLLKHSTIYAVDTVLRQLTNFLMLPVYTHLLSPADFLGPIAARLPGAVK